MSAAAVVSGFRIIRKLGEGQRAEVFLARTERGAQSEQGQSDAVFTPGTLAIKVYRAGTQQHDWVTEVEALERSGGAHVVGLSDIATSANDRTALVLERLEGGSLAMLLRQCRDLSVGEAITIAAPIVETIARMHAAGVAHGAVSARSVLFSRDGAPVLARFGSAVLVEPEMPRARRAADQQLIRDVSATLDFAASVLRSVSVDREVRALLAWLEENGEVGTPDVLAELTAKLYDLGEPAPVQFSDELELDAVSSARDAAWRSVQAGRSGLTPDDTEGTRLGAQATAAFLLPAWLTGQLDQWLAAGRPLARVRDAIALRVPAELADRITAARISLSVVRPRVWLVAVGVVVALVTAVNVVPQPAGDNTEMETAIDGGIDPAIDTGDSGQDETADINEPEASQHPAILADDPVAAAVALVAAREQCIRSRSVLCLDGVAQAGSAALGEDQDLVRAIQGGAELSASWSLNAVGVTVLERLGDSVLLDIGGQNDVVTMILMMKGDAGWRFRDYLP